MNAYYRSYMKPSNNSYWCCFNTILELVDIITLRQKKSTAKTRYFLLKCAMNRVAKIVNDMVINFSAF